MHPENKMEDCMTTAVYREPKSCLDNNDSDDGYSISDDNLSHVTIESCGDATSSSSGLPSSLSHSQSSSIEQSVESGVVKKIIKEYSNPDYRIVFRANGKPKYWDQKALENIDLLKEHTKLTGDAEEEDTDGLTPLMTNCSKVSLIASLVENSAKKSEPMIKIQIRNIYRLTPMHLQRLLWINMSQHKIMTMNSFQEPKSLAASESTSLFTSIKELELSKEYKLVLYYGAQGLIFSKEFILKLTTRPLRTMSLEPLNHYFPEPVLRQLDRLHFKVPNGGDVLDDVKELKEQIIIYEKSEAASRLTSENYHSVCKLLLQMEDETDSKRSLRHDQYKQTVKHEFGVLYSLIINNERLEAAVNEYTRIWITPMTVRMAEMQANQLQQSNRPTNGRNWVPRAKKNRVYGSVVEVKGNKIYFELTEPLSRFTRITKVEPVDEEYFIRFMSDRTTTTLEHRALDYLLEQKIAKFFFPNPLEAICWPSNLTHPESFVDRPISWVSNDINTEQKAAVQSILMQTSYPYPYLLFGPPGTGKTKTLIEAIWQIIHNNNPNQFILVCATSNSACNEVAKRLIGSGADGQVFRIFSKSALLNKLDIPNEVLAASNLQTGEHYYPSLQKIYQYKVIICTLTTAGRLSQGKINPKHFSHIFIDEAGSATETQTLIAISGLCTTENQMHANVIFAGDPKQLGPVVKSQQAVKMGYGVSMLERLITTCSLYSRDETTKCFNPKYVTQLIRNYRSHSSILHCSNKMYYGNVLQVCAPTSNTNWFLRSDLLKQPEFPMIFHSVKGITMRDHTSPSSYNQQEIDILMGYLQRILKMSQPKVVQSDIGIISPYRRQCEKLTEQCAQKGYNDIQIGSVETYQGQEKPIIIVSTVRSQMNSIGFLDSKKRLNVLLTRAKCLLIIIGDADTLAKDVDWSYVIQFCKENKSLVV